MSDIAIIEQVSRISAESIAISGIFTDGQTFKIPFSYQLNGIRTLEQVRQRLASALDVSRAQTDLNIPVGEFDLTEPIKPPVDPPVDDGNSKERLSINYRNKLNLYRQLEAAEKFGVTLGVDLQTMKDELIKDYTPGYEVFFTTGMV